MKKYIGIIICALLSLWRVAAQDVQNASAPLKTEPTKIYLPQKGDFSLGINITPLVEFLGNAFNGYGTNGTKNTIGSVGGGVVDLGLAPKPDVSIMGKYFLKNDIAVRASLGVLGNKSSQRAYVTSDALAVTDPLSAENLVDGISNYNSGGNLTVGLEKRIGKNRIQGVFSADILLACQTSKIDYSYGNELTTVNSKPSVSSIMPTVDASGYRTTQRYNGNSYYTGGMLNAGVEYFICPKLAIGSEVNMMVYYKFGSSAYEVREGLNLYTNQMEKRTVLSTPGNNSLVLNTGNFSSKLYLTFYF